MRTFKIELISYQTTILLIRSKSLHVTLNFATNQETNYILI